jgi:biotin operon repressor
MPSKKRTSTSTKREEVSKAAKSNRSTEQAMSRTKKQQLIDLLSGGKPVPVDLVGKKLNWQRHTVRAAIAGLRKAGFAVDSTKTSTGDGTCYRIVGQGSPANASA